jgi:hypothetical protein
LDWWLSSSSFEPLEEKEFPDLGPAAAVQRSLVLKLSLAALLIHSHYIILERHK